MRVQQAIETKLREGLSPSHLEVINESSGHNVPPGSESHFKVIVVSEHFEGRALVMRHRAVNTLLAEELAGPVHALSIQAFTAEQWRERDGATFASPKCRGGSKT